MDFEKKKMSKENMKETKAKAAMVERYPDPSIEDPQLYDKLLTLPGGQVSWKGSCGGGNGDG